MAGRWRTLPVRAAWGCDAGLQLSRVGTDPRLLASAVQSLVTSAKFTLSSVGFVKLQKVKSISFQSQPRGKHKYKICSPPYKRQSTENFMCTSLKQSTLIKIYKSFQCFCILQKILFNPQMNFRLFYQITFSRNRLIGKVRSTYLIRESLQETSSWETLANMGKSISIRCTFLSLARYPKSVSAQMSTEMVIYSYLLSIF